MKMIIIVFFTLLLLFGCSKKPKIVLKELPQTELQKATFADLPQFNSEKFDAVLTSFIKNCQTKKAQMLYGSLCKRAEDVKNPKVFIEKNFDPYLIINQTANSRGVLTGYYEAQINASYKKSKRYRYPIYATPKDLVVVDLSSVYPELKHYRLRGRVEQNRVVPYYTRADASLYDLNASVLCYCDSAVDKFFLEVQGSGIAKMDDNSSFYLGYADQNGHKYRSIGKYLIEKKELKKEEVSLQSIKRWLREHPQRVDEVLNYNSSMVFFSKRDHGATGALGIELTPMRSVAVDRKYIFLGSMLYLSAELDSTVLSRFVFAQDTGGAIRGSVRADLFTGSGKKAFAFAGKLNAPLKLWMILPKEREN